MRFAFLLFTYSALANAAEPTWWSLTKPSRPELPERSEANPIDRFIREKQDALNLTPAKPADKGTLARRLAYDLWGMPLSPERLNAFLKDTRPEAYTELVDELLASPRYGERWARHWLDIVHYGESHGYDKDQPRSHAWPYRDYVIRSFNKDKPYARFVREQIAGDILWPHSEDGIVATGFLSAGPWDLIGHEEVPETKIDGKVARHLDRDDMVAATMISFCSLTAHCAQCHDHMADPVAMKDYYSLQAVFAAIDRTNREYDLDPAVAKKRSQLKKEQAASKDRLSQAEKALEKAKTPEIKKLNADIAKLRKGSSKDRLGYHAKVASKQETVKWVQIDLGKARPIDRIEILGAIEYGFDDFGFPHRFKVEASNKADFSRSAMLADFQDKDYPRPGSSPVVLEGKKSVSRYVRITATKLWSRRHKGKPLTTDWIFALGEMTVVSKGKGVEVKRITSLDSIEALPRWGHENLIDGGPAEVNGNLTSLVSKRDELLNQVAAKEFEEIKSSREKVEHVTKQLAALPKPRLAYVGAVHHGKGNFIGRGHLNGQPRDIHILDRGDVTQPLDKVAPNPVPGIVPGMDQFDLPKDHTEGDRRVALANWIIHPDNTLTWRSIVNRIWQYHFGTGLVETANDFGRIGEKPSHPELLDWLAVEFRDSGGSMKKLHRLILNSDTYKQSSQHSSANAAIDNSNKFLWRKNRRRLDAESLRDSVLIAAGKMNFKMGGPSFQDFIIEKPQHSPHYKYNKSDPDNPATHRRSIYRFLVRSQPQPFMDALDCADPSLHVDRRGETTTALQALALMNNKFMVRMAEHFATKIASQPDPVGTAIQLTLGRNITNDERALLEAYQKKHGLPATCRIIFNLSEFSYVD
ncbi:DUF1553 domain-containing protein [bacterium]|nr:DUF1553 domain-containing protein [bacterium]